jgi:hypothetical protein
MWRNWIRWLTKLVCICGTVAVFYWFGNAARVSGQTPPKCKNIDCINVICLGTTTQTYPVYRRWYYDNGLGGLTAYQQAHDGIMGLQSDGYPATEVTPTRKLVIYSCDGQESICNPQQGGSFVAEATSFGVSTMMDENQYVCLPW